MKCRNCGKELTSGDGQMLCFDCLQRVQTPDGGQGMNRWYSEETMAAVVKERDELKEINREMLERLLDIAMLPGFNMVIRTIEKATGKPWAEIKEAGE